MSLAVSGYIRQFYRGNSFGATQSGRAGQPAYSLVPADIKAIKSAVKSLGKYDYEEGEGGELMKKVQAFVDTYNNYIESAKGMDDRDVNRYLNKLKKITKENAGEFAEIGVTVQSSGKLKINKKTLEDTSRYQVSRLFSEDAEFSKQVQENMKRTDRMFQRNNLGIPKKPVQANNAANGTANAANLAMAGRQAAGDAQLAGQLMQAISGNKFDYMV